VGLSKKAGLSARSIALRLSALRQFCHFLVEQHQLTQNPAEAVNAPKMGKPLPKHLHVEQLEGLLNSHQNQYMKLVIKRCLNWCMGVVCVYLRSPG